MLKCLWLTSVNFVRGQCVCLVFLHVDVALWYDWKSGAEEQDADRKYLFISGVFLG